MARAAVQCHIVAPVAFGEGTHLELWRANSEP